MRIVWNNTCISTYEPDIFRGYTFHFFICDYGFCSIWGVDVTIENKILPTNLHGQCTRSTMLWGGKINVGEVTSIIVAIASKQQAGARRWTS